MDFLKGGRGLILAYDQGMEHGPTDFNRENVDPSYIIDIAVRGGFTGLVLQKGVAEKYYEGGVPLILKLNGKTSLVKGEPVSRQICSVEEALSLGARGVGYTIYIGSSFESVMFQEFAEIHREARAAGLPVILWCYPRGGRVENDRDPAVIAYASRVALELGADLVKVKYTGDPDSFSWAVRSAGRTLVLAAGGPKTETDSELLEMAAGVIQAGARGMAIGRNIWQHPEPLEIARKLRKIVL